MLLSCQNISVGFVTGTVLDSVSFHIENGEKAAIVGINGAGKTTLLKVIVGQLEPDSGTVVTEKDRTVGYLAQNDAVNTDNTIIGELTEVKRDLINMEDKLRSLEAQMGALSGDELDSVMEKYQTLLHTFQLLGGETYNSEIYGVLKGLGFAEDEYEKSIANLSGGQKTRVALGKMLLAKPDLIILDEPTNHLDLNSISWLEGFLKNYKGAVLIVSHDRYFLDRVVTKVIELENGKSSVFSGNYSDYSVKKEQRRIAELNAYINQQRDIKHQEAVIEKLKSFNREKSIKRAESREKMLDKVERLEKPATVNADMKLVLTPHVRSGEDVLQVEGMSKSYGELQLFTDVNIDIKRGEHVAIIGNNGTGKTTLLKILNGLETADTGSYTLGTNVEIGYYDQEHHVLHAEKTLYDEIADEYPYLTITEIRNTLAAFLFTGDDVFKLVGDLSGGERGRLSLAKLMLSDCNLLILDEPTNHLDIQSKEILETAINSYEGTVLYVSHDRYFINRTASRILELSGKKFTNYLGNYDYYLEKRENIGTAAGSNAVNRGIAGSAAMGGKAKGGAEASDLADGIPGSGTASQQDWKEQKARAAEQRKKENAIKKCEEDIALLEAELTEIDAKLSDPANGGDAALLMSLTGDREKAASCLDELYERWETLSEELSRI